MKVQKRSITAFIIMVLVLMTGCAEQNNGAEAIAPNAASKMIDNLESYVTPDNIGKYDFTERAMAYLEHLGTGNNSREAVREWIVSELKSAGYSEKQITLESFKDSMLDDDGTNVILTVAGEDPSRQIIAGAHYDGEGVGDNGSGIALLLANAVGLQGVRPHYTTKYIFFDREEDGCIGSRYNADQMTEEEIDSTIYMINLDSLAFGDYCNIYGGSFGDSGMEIAVDQLEAPQDTEAYSFAADTAQNLGFNVMRTADLDGYFAEHGTGPDIRDNTLYTNPWTPENPAPANNSAMSPATIPASDHIGYMDLGIEYIYFEATNWFAESGNDEVEGTSFTGYIETYDYSLGDHGMFMNTEYDTWKNLNEYFPGRAQKHFEIYSPLLSALLLVSE